jgi:SWIM zinc finger
MEKGRIEFENESSRFIKSDKRAKAIANMGLVERDGDTFKVSTPSLRGNQTSYKVWRDNGTPNGQPSRVKCNCLEYEEEVKNNTSFRCSHILAVKYSLIQKVTVISESTVEAEKEIKTAEIASTAQESISMAEFLDRIFSIRLSSRQKEVMALLEKGEKIKVLMTREEFEK